MMQSLDYFDLLRAARHLDIADTAKTVRLAVLGDFSTQQLMPLLKVLCARQGVRLDIYEAGYDSIDVEILNPQSGLYAFKPDFVAILLAGQKLKTKLYDAPDRLAFADGLVDRLTGLWSALRRQSPATIIQTNFVTPSERAFGHFELNVADSIGAVFAQINYRLMQELRRANNVMLCDVDFLAGEIGRTAWYDDRLWSMAKTFCHLDHLPRFAKSLTDIMLAAQGRFVKCVVLDLDNTLWGGVIGDDGLGGIVLGDYDEGEAFVALQKFILNLKRRGIILAVVSKNDHDNAIMPFREHPNMVLKEEDIAVFVANWDNKVDNIRLVQKTLNIGFDSIVFLDDNPFERNIVRQYLPDVIVPELPEDPALYLRALANLNLFETASYSDADRTRADQYREEAQRERVKAGFTDVNDYLISLEMKIRLERFKPVNLTRIAQLIQRSNQFNLCTRRYSEAACATLMHDADTLALTVTLSDKFGDYGLISVVIANIAGNTLVIDEYLMSCRVLQRGVEQYVMNRLVDVARARGLTAIVGHYIRTAKNDMVKHFFARFGFERLSETDGGSEWRLDVAAYVPGTVFMTPVIDDIDQHKE